MSAEPIYRFNLQLSAKAAEELNALVDSLDAASKTEVIRRAIHEMFERQRSDEFSGKRIPAVNPRPPVISADAAAARKTQQELLVAMWNTGYPVGTSCLYEEVVGDAGKRSCTTLSEAWLLGGHTAVVRVEFTLPTKHRIDTVSLEHITLPNAEPPPGP